MSTEATGDGRTDAVDAAEADVAAGGAEPSVTVVAEPEDAEPPDAEPEDAEPEDALPPDAGPAATAPTAWDTAVPSAWGTPDLTDADSTGIADSTGAADSAMAEGLVPGQAAPGDAASADESAESDESSETDESSQTDDAAASVAAEESDETVADYEDDEDDEASEYGGAVEYEEEYDEEYEAEEAGDVAKPRRARRWPRLLLALGFVVLGAAIVGGAVAIVGLVTHGFKKPVKVTYTKSPLFSLKTGDCFDPRGQSYSLLSCNSPHEAEVFATFTLSGSKWPGDAAVAKDASAGCATRLTGYLNPQLTISLSQAYVYPDSVAWQAGTRTVICEVRAQSGQLTGSVRAASATAG